MRKFLPSLLLLLTLLGAAARAEDRPAAKPSLDRLFDALTAVRTFKEVAISPDGQRVAWVEVLPDKAGDPLPPSEIYVADLRSPEAEPRRITAGNGTAAHAEHSLAWSPDGSRLAFLSDREKKGQLQLYLASADRGPIRKVTNLTGHLAGPRWSPGGGQIALLFIENATRTPGPVEAGSAEVGVVEEKVEEQRLALVNLDYGRARLLSPADLHVYEFDWSPDGERFVAVAAHGSGDNNWYIARLYTLEAGSGALKQILKPSMQIAGPRWSPDGKSIAFIGGLMSDEGVIGGDIYTLPSRGGEARNLTPDLQASASSLTWLPSSRLLFSSHVDGGCGIATLDPASGAVRKLWTGAETIAANGWPPAVSLARDGKTSALIRHSFGRPPEVWAGPISDWKQLTHRNDKAQPQWGEARSLHWKSDDFTVQGWLLYPRDYDPKRRYPMIVSVHGGPASVRKPSWPGTFFDLTALAAEGYFVFFPNPRGSYGHGEKFTRANVKDFGHGDLRDILAGVDEVLKTVPVDKDRLAIAGWSYGGYMTMWALTQTHRFRAAVAGAGIANWQSYYGQNGIDQWLLPFFGATVYDDPAVYSRSSPITFIKRVQTPTLVLVGERDLECPVPQSREYWHALRTLGVPTQLMIYPGEGHRVSRPDHRRDIMKRSLAWLDKHLQADRSHKPPQGADRHPLSPPHPNPSPPRGEGLTPQTLRNPGFENKLDGWSVHVYGAQSQIAADDTIRHEGRQSLRISAVEPSDTALGQEVQLRAGRWYRLSGWVRTRGLVLHGASVFGTFQVQLPDGRGILASGLNHGSDTDWTEVALGFHAPADGRARIAVFLAGFGRGTGTAWFDDLKLEEVDLARTPVKVTRDVLCPGEISPLQYGQFIEYLCDLVPGMWAEKLHDGTFEGLTPYKFVFLKETDFRAKAWYPCGAVNRAEHSLDRSDPVSGAVAQKIAVPAGPPCTVGIAQDGIAIDRGKACVFSCWLRQEGLQGPVKIRLHHEGTVHAAHEFRPTEKWVKYSARLVPSAGDTNATLTIEFRGPGTLWIDNASLMPEDNIGGWRPDVVAAVRALKPGIIRFGGSALDDENLGDFEWRDTLGDPDRRKPFRAWGGLQPTGPGLEEIVQFCRLVEAEPLLCVRFRGRSPKDAAEQVEYFNGSADTPLGRLRAGNGHPQPYGVKYWQVGNEREGTEYEKRLAEFCKAMKAVDPSIKLLSSYPRPGVLRQAGELLDYVCPHHYECEDLAREENDLLATRALCRSLAPHRPLRIAVTEWNTTGGDWGPRRARLWTMENALACARYHNLLHRHCDLVEIANRSNLTNSFCSGIIQTDNHRLYKTPTYYAQQLYAVQTGNRPLQIASTMPSNVAPDLSATLSRGGDVVILFAVNSTFEDITRPLDLSAFGGSGGQEVEVWTLADSRQAGEPDVANSFADPQRVRVRSSRFAVSGARFDYCFPALSLTVLRWRVDPGKSS
jgi:dipeptidyl aminopeptidase/acylaminoacyl peptidase/alpha-L-arabinofuranosidase